MSKPTKKAYLPLNVEEKELMHAEQKNELIPLSAKEFFSLKQKLVKAAKNTADARKMISIKIRESDLVLLKKEAEKKGLRYQSLINSIIHQYVTGHFRSV